MNEYTLQMILAEFSDGHDAMTGHGYGCIGKSSGSGTTWTLDSSFPYYEDDEDKKKDEEIADLPDDDIKTRSAVNRPQYAPPAGRVDRGSLIKGRGLGEAFGVGGSSNPKWTDVTKNTTGSGEIVKTKYINHTSSPRKSGEKAGFSTRPPAEEIDNEFVAYTKDDIMTDDEKALAKTKLIHDKMVEEFKIIVRRNYE